MLLLILDINCNVKYKLIYTDMINAIYFYMFIDSSDVSNPEYEPYYKYNIIRYIDIMYYYPN